jgi:amino acid adenylation domain-containing protein/FkbM family methyltransferase
MSALLTSGQGLRAGERHPATVEHHPTSYAQRRMWFLQMLDPSSPVYNIPCGFRHQGALDVAVLRRALDEIVRRHESLRTTFTVDDGEPVQVIAGEQKQAVEVVDLRPFPEPQRYAEVQRLAFVESMTPFDLERGPLLRATVLVVGDADPFLLFTMHHIVSDGWSVRLFFQELAALLAAYAAGAASPLEDLPTQYSAYARWQRERLSGPALEALLAYWRQQLAGAPAVIELPLDRPRPKVQRFVGATLPVMLDAKLHSDLVRLAQDHEATLFMVLLAGFSLLLHRYSGQTDIVLGTPVALREKPELESLIGLFVNTLVLRIDLSGRPSVEELLRRVVDVTVDAYSNQELPFERLVEALQPDRSLSHQPIVQAVFTLLSTMTQAGHSSPTPSADPEEGPRPPATPVPSTAKFDLTLSLAESENGLWGGVEYNVDLFDAPTVAHFVERLRIVLAAMVADPAQPVATLPLLNGAERHLILTACNATARLWDSDATVVQRIWDQADAHPGDIAVIVDRGGTTTYREIADRAEDVAARLRARGIGPGDLVPVCLHRSSDLLAALLGILRAGAAYVPLDPDHPKARIDAMVEGIGARVALVSAELADRLPAAGLERLSVATAEMGNDAPPRDLPAYPSLADLAYAIFTSGSTGKPKCAANPHGALLNRLLWMQDAFPLGAGDRVLQKTPYTFDVSVWELFWPLMFGSTVVFAVPGEHGDPAYLAEVISSHHITTMHFVPSMLRAFLEHPHSRRCTSLRWVIASGEALPPDVVGLFHSRLNAELHNLYGPTECAIDVTHWPCRRGVGAPVVPIGYPIWNVHTHILDTETFEPVPFGAKGELFIAGAAVGRGYVGQPDLTAERFLPDPFSLEENARMYRSGDLARYRADASIEYLGRADHQLKVRGFRIEAGEVERALCSHQAIVDAVVTVRSTGSSDQRLVAHCVPDPKAGSVVRSLLRYERQGLLADDLMVEEMANGLSVIAKNRGETLFLYEEIFADESYLRNGIDLRPGSVVFDVGANIGMFAMYAGWRCPGAKVYAFEPIPEIHKLLALNAGLYPWDIEPRQLALGREAGTASFTYYPHVSILSGRYADSEEERDVILAFEANRGYEGPELEKLVADRLQAELVQCQVKTISQVLAEEGLRGIDLLKIDVEKSEHDVLAGISDADWPQIRQVAVEVHEIGARVSQVCDLLHRQGFVVTVDQEALLRGSGVSMVFGRRAGASAETGGADTASWLPASPTYLRDQVCQLVAAQLPDYMVPSELIWLEEMPRLSSGKIDRKSLPAGSARIHQATRSQRSVAPRTPTEVRIAQIVADVLGCGSVGLYDRFFDLGGHSLLATSAIARMRDAFGVEVSLRDFFEDPTVAGLARCIESEDASSSELAATIPRTIRGPQDLAPLSFTQQRLWFLDRFSPGDISYNIPVVLPLPFRVDAALLERSLSEIARRHEILRTTFPFVDAAPAQRISSDATVRLQMMDVSSLDPAIIPNEVYGLVLREIRRPFDLANGPILRALLVRSAPEQQVLVLTMHHIAADGWSMSILYRELATIYDAFGKGLPSPLPELPVQFADFAKWQREWLTGEALERQHNYWRRCLEGAPKLLELPTDYPRPAVQSTRGDIYLFKIEPAVYGDLSILARQENCTPFMAFLATYNVLFHRLCGSRDISVGSPIANRRRPELEGLIGFFSNTIILRTTWEGDPSFRTLLRTVRDVTLGAFAHQDMPFEHLVSEFESERALDRTPLFQVMLIFQNLEGWDSTGLVEAPPVATGTSKFDLSLYLLPSGAGLTGQLEFCVDLFSREGVACMMDQYCELLAQIAAAPDAPVSSLPLRTEAPSAPTPEGLESFETLAARIERLAERNPDAPAVLCGAQEVTYAGLVRRARLLASRLGETGCLPGDLVAVAIEPSLELIVSLLALSRLGAAYLVLHPEDPEARVAALLGPESRLLLFAGTRPPGCATLESLAAMDVRSESDLDTPTFSPPPLPRGDARATVVPVWDADGPRRDELDQRRLAWRLQHSPLAAFAGRRVACASVPSADAVLYLATLYHGSCLILQERDPTVSTRTFSRTLRSTCAEVLVAGPQILSVLAREFARSLKQVAVVVELADPEEIQQLRAALPAQVHDGCRWILGVAGAGFVSLSAAAGGDVVLEAAASEPVAVVAETLQLAPLGAFGELVFAGPDAGGELQRTGVRALRTASGAIKLRAGGELLRKSHADVECALRRCAGVTDAVVAFDKALEDPVAFVTQEPRTSAALISGELRTWLRPQRIPKTIRFVTGFPLRSNGRIDLPTLIRQSQSGAAQYTAPRTELEHGIARLWTETLGVEKVSVHDDFFVLGGHSLLATAFIAKLNLAFGIELPLRTLFEHPTIETLARVVSELAKEDLGAPAARLVRSTADGPAPLSFAQQRLWFLDRYEPDSPLYNIVGALPLRLSVSVAALERAVNAIVRRHESLRLRFGVLDWEPVQLVEADVHVPVPLFDLRAFDPAHRQAETARLTEEIARESFDLEQAPLIRLRLVQCEDEDYVLLLSIHHIVADGWSLEIFSRELSFFYAAFAAGETVSLPELPIQFTDYARWQRSWFTGDVLNRHISYWRRMLAGAPPLLRLPEDFPRPPAQVFEGQQYHATLAGDLISPLRDFCRAEGATTFMTLLAAYAALLSRYTGSADIVLGTPFANRRLPELAGMIGFIANTMALRVDLSGPVSFRELVGRVRSLVLESYEYQDTPFEKIVEELQPDRDASFNPLFQLAFMHRTTEQGGPPGSDADSPAGSPRTGTAKFDFSMSLWESPHEISSEVEFRATLYSAEMVRRFVASYQRLLRSALADPERPVTDFDLLVPEEKAWVLAVPARPAVEEAAHDTVVEIARSHPDRIAVQTSRMELRHGDLLSRSDRCTAALRDAGVGPGTRVGIYVPDATDELVAMLSVARAGGICVPLSRFDSVQRLRARLEETDTRTLLTTYDAGGHFPEVHDLVAIDALPEDLPVPAPVRVDPGAPVLIGEAGLSTSHRAFAASVRAEIQEAALAGDEVTLISGLRASLVLHDAMAVWISGGTVVLPDLREQGDPRALRQLAETREAVRAYVPANALRELADPELAGHDQPARIRELVVEYEPGLPVDLIESLRGRRDECRVFERLLSPLGLPALHRWPLASGKPKSRPRPGLAVRILDPRLNTAPIGIPGSLYLTNPEGGAPAGMQELGVFGRWLDDGSIQILGRTAARLHVRGYDVDRDLVESVLRSVPGARDVAVISHRDELLAFLLGSYTEADARAKLNERVAAFMIPGSFNRSTQLPRLWNGEIDRRSLPANADREDGVAAPRTDFEKQVVTAFSDALGWDAVGIHEDFLALGGHCREAIRIAASLSEVLDTSIEATDVFFHSNAEALAITLAQRSLAGEEDAERLLAEIESLDDSELQALLSEEETPFTHLP